MFLRRVGRFMVGWYQDWHDFSCYCCDCQSLQRIKALCRFYGRDDATCGTTKYATVLGLLSKISGVALQVSG